jgi:transposase
MGMRNYYPSDITREEFSLIENQLENVRKITRPRKYDLYDIFCAVLYVLKEGITWRSLPHDFPKWNLVYHYFRIWSTPDETSGKSLFESILRPLIMSERIISGRQPQTSMVIVDSKSVKNTDTAEQKGYDAGKKLLA